MSPHGILFHWKVFFFSFVIKMKRQKLRRSVPFYVTAALQSISNWHLRQLHTTKRFLVNTSINTTNFYSSIHGIYWFSWKKKDTEVFKRMIFYNVGVATSIWTIYASIRGTSTLSQLFFVLIRTSHFMQEILCIFNVLNAFTLLLTFSYSAIFSNNK